MTRDLQKIGLAVVALALMVPTASAHTGIGNGSGFLDGFAHPFFGLDHILAMTMVGLFAYLLGQRALWLLPASFIIAMAAGGALGMAGLAIPLGELAIAFSVIALSTVVATGGKPPVVAAMALVGFFSIFHGHAHGMEMPDTASGITYMIGFLLATAALHISGIGFGFAIDATSWRYGRALARSAGGLATIAGLFLVAGTF